MMCMTSAGHPKWHEFSWHVQVHICHQYVPSGAKVGRVAATCGVQLVKGFNTEPRQL